MPVLLTKELGYSLGSGLQWLALSQFIGAFITPLAGIGADFLGRKKTIFLTFTAFGISAYLLFYFGGAAGQLFMIIMMCCLSMCNGINWVYVPENFPNEIRTTGMGFASACGRVGGILGPAIIGYLYSFGSINLILNINLVVLVGTGLLVMIFGRETKGKSLEEITKLNA